MDNSQAKPQTQPSPLDSNWVIPFASCLDANCLLAISELKLPNLARFLQNSHLTETLIGDEFDFLPPHERFELLAPTQASTNKKTIVLTPCHWAVGIDRITMGNPQDLQLSNEEAQALFALMRPYFLEDGIELMYSAPLRWYASGDGLRALEGLPLASLHRVIGRHVDAWQPPEVASRAIRRLQNEMQMLLYTHPINDHRASRGLPTVNSFWLSHDTISTRYTPHSLTNAALANDWDAWSNAWTALDAKVPNLTSLTLCGERHAKTYTQNAHLSVSLGQRMKIFFSKKPSPQQVLCAL
jgi:hypothetical protein